MARRTTLALGLAVAVWSAGCGTVSNIKQPTHAPPSNPDAPVCRIYGGVRDDFSAMTDLPWRRLPTYLDYVVIPLMCALDLVCTGFGDTVTLPYTIGSEIARAFGPPEPRPEPVVQSAPAGPSGTELPAPTPVVNP